jgi:hypothetical protein
MKDKKSKLEAAIAKMKEELAELEEQLEAAGMPPKDVLLQLLSGCEVKLDLKKYPHSVFLFKDGKCFFEIEGTRLWCSYNNVWTVFKDEHSMSHDEIRSLIKSAVEEHFKIKGVTPILLYGQYAKRVEEYFKMKAGTLNGYGYSEPLAGGGAF